MLKNIFMAQLGFELTTSATAPGTALSVTSTDCAIETTPKKIVRIALILVLANAVHVVNRVLPYASHLFRLQMKAYIYHVFSSVKIVYFFLYFLYGYGIIVVS